MATDITLDEPDEFHSAEAEEAWDGEEELPEDEAAKQQPTRPRRRAPWRSILRAPIKAPRFVTRLLMRRPIVTLSALMVVAVLLAAAVGVGAYFQQQQTAMADARRDAAEAARTGITAILSYEYQTFDRDVAEGSKLLTGEFQKRYKELMLKTVKKPAIEEQTVTTASIARSSIISATPDTVESLLFVNQTTTSKNSKGPQLNGSRVQAKLTKVEGRWLISNMTPL